MIWSVLSFAALRLNEGGATLERTGSHETGVKLGTPYRYIFALWRNSLPLSANLSHISFSLLLLSSHPAPAPLIRYTILALYKFILYVCMYVMQAAWNQAHRTVKLSIYETGVARSCLQWTAVFCDWVAKSQSWHTESACTGTAWRACKFCDQVNTAL